MHILISIEEYFKRTRVSTPKKSNVNKLYYNPYICRNSLTYSCYATGIKLAIYLQECRMFWREIAVNVIIAVTVFIVAIIITLILTIIGSNIKTHSPLYLNIALLLNKNLPACTWQNRVITLDFFFCRYDLHLPVRHVSYPRLPTRSDPCNFIEH